MPIFAHIGTRPSRTARYRFILTTLSVRASRDHVRKLLHIPYNPTRRTTASASTRHSSLYRATSASATPSISSYQRCAVFILSALRKKGADHLLAHFRTRRSQRRKSSASLTSASRTRGRTSRARRSPCGATAGWLRSQSGRTSIPASALFTIPFPALTVLFTVIFRELH